VEGDPGIDRCVILEFDTMQALRGFYDSPEYAPLLAMRLACTVSRAAIVEGITPG
jgi:uncharacterized protein (DUF1330 family)